MLSGALAFEGVEDVCGGVETADTARGLGLTDDRFAPFCCFAGPPDMDDLSFGIYVVPAQSGGFAGAEPEVEHDRPHRFEVGAGGGCHELLCLRDGHRLPRLAGAVGGWEFGVGGDVAGDEFTALRPRERLGEGGTELDQRRPRQRRSGGAATAGAFRGGGAIGPSHEGGFDVVGGEVADLEGAEFVGEDPDRPPMPGQTRGGQSPVRQRLGLPHLEQLGEGHRTGCDRLPTVGESAEFVELAACFGLGLSGHGAGLAIDDHTGDPPVAIRAIEQGAFATSAPTVVLRHPHPQVSEGDGIGW